MTTNSLPLRVGELRPSQLLWAHGVGALVDLPHLAVVVRGLERWDPNRSVPIDEPRLREAVRKVLGPQVERLLAAPLPVNGDRAFDPFGDDARVGVPVVPFPEWLRCPQCGALAPIRSGLFDLREERYRPDFVRYEHVNCNKGRHPTAVPARFLVACRDGHLDDFPWHYYVHRGQSECRGSLRFYETGASLETANLWVSCLTCDVKPRSMVEAFNRERPSLPACRGRHPHLDRFDEGCTERLRPLLLGASNGWFPASLSILSVPTESDRLVGLVEAHWGRLEHARSVEIVKVFRDTGDLVAFADFDDDAVFAAIQQHRAKLEAPSDSTEAVLDLKGPEWEVFEHPESAPRTDDFLISSTAAPPGMPALSGVILAERLREVNALVGFTRVEPPEEGGQPDGPKRAPLTSAAPSWALATEVRGEGVFLRFDRDYLRAWHARPAVVAREARLLQGYRRWRAARRMPPNDAAFPGVLFVAIHSLAHALIREFAIECGYSAAAIRERIYARMDGDTVEMAGLMLYTAAPDSEGTLGGLVELGRPENLARLLQQALAHASLCSSDPLCAEHEPTQDRSLHGAACHACLFASETSCEVGNRFLDRALLVPVFGAPIDTALFEGVD